MLDAIGNQAFLMDTRIAIISHTTVYFHMSQLHTETTHIHIHMAWFLCGLYTFAATVVAAILFLLLLFANVKLA